MVVENSALFLPCYSNCFLFGIWNGLKRQFEDRSFDFFRWISGTLESNHHSIGLSMHIKTCSLMLQSGGFMKGCCKWSPCACLTLVIKIKSLDATLSIQSKKEKRKRKRKRQISKEVSQHWAWLICGQWFFGSYLLQRLLDKSKLLNLFLLFSLLCYTKGLFPPILDLSNLNLFYVIPFLDEYLSYVILI
jgi:hypothetical protein